MTDKKSSNTQKQTIKKLFSKLKPYRFYIIISLIMALITVAGTLYVPVLIGKAIDCIILKDDKTSHIGEINFKIIGEFLTAVGITVIITGIAQWIMNICNNKITFNVTADIRNEAIEKIEKLPLSYIDSHSTGDTLSRVISDVDTFADGLLMGFTQFFTGIMTILGTIGFMFYKHWGIALMVVFLTPLSLFVAKFISKRTFTMFTKQSVARGEQTALVEEMIGAQKVIKAFGYGNKAIEKFDDVNERLKEYSLKATFYSSLTNPCTRFVNSLVYASVTLIGGFMCISSSLTVGSLSCLLSFANQYTKPFNEITGVITELQNALACAGRIFELIEEPSEPENIPNAVELCDVSGNVDINNVDFSYDPNKELIKNFNLKVKSGQRVAIVGPTGCGKTTMINLLMRFYDVTGGEITIDSVPLKSAVRESVRRNFGMVLQETWFKSGTIRDNITMGLPGYTDEQIIKACKESHSYEFIKRMSNGLDTYITEDGSSMSQGQKQLLCITRVMLTLPNMLILDEATSSIDTRTEQKIQSAFAKMMIGRTSFIVAHRLSTIKSADIIIVMKDGKIIEQGNHKTLLDKNGFYANLYKSQFE